MKESVLRLRAQAPDVADTLRLLIDDELLGMARTAAIEGCLEKARAVMEAPVEQIPLPEEWGLGAFLNGFAALAKMTRESNGGVVRGDVSAEDPIFARLLLWEDRNHNGISEPDELRPVAELLSRVGLGYGLHKRRDGHGNEFRYRGWAEARTGPGVNRARNAKEHQERLIDIYDVFFVILR